MKLKRGDTRSDGMIYWGKHSNYSSGEYWMSKEQFERSKLLKKKRYDKKNELLNLKNNLLRTGGRQILFVLICKVSLYQSPVRIPSAE